MNCSRIANLSERGSSDSLPFRGIVRQYLYLLAKECVESFPKKTLAPLKASPLSSAETVVTNYFGYPYLGNSWCPLNYSGIFYYCTVSHS